MINEIKMMMESDDFVQEATEAKAIVSKYKSIMEELDYVCATIDKMEKMKDNLMKEIEITRNLESDLYKRCREKYGHRNVLNEFLSGVSHE